MTSASFFHHGGMKSAGMQITPDGEEGLHLALSWPYDTAIVDIMLPGRDGLSLIANMRQKGEHPVIIPKVRGRPQGTVAGGDDYLTKPFASRSSWRVQALIRRTSGATDPTHWSWATSRQLSPDDRGAERLRCSPRARSSNISCATPAGSSPRR
jgi:DNA-binding response OmpR family regulator